MVRRDWPVDLLAMVVDLVNFETLKQIRLASHRLVPLASKRLFNHIYVDPTPESIAKCKMIMAHKDLNHRVHKITMEVPELDEPGGDDESEMYDSGMEDTEEPMNVQFKEFLSQLSGFRNLQRVEIQYQPECAVCWRIDERRGHYDYQDSMLQPYSLRKNTLMALLRVLDTPGSRVRSLVVKNLQDVIPKELKSSDLLSNVLYRLSSLALQIATEYNEAAPEHTLEWLEPWDFFENDLKKYWLQPTQNNLYDLKLYATQMYWGYTPMCDTRNLFFPKLRSLALGNMTFVWDWQLDWILSHKTLESLILDDCPIISAGIICAHAGREREPPGIAGIYGRENRPHTSWTYEARWHNYFDKIRDGLPHLKHFAVGHGDWLRNRAFDDAHLLEPKLEDSRYAIFDNGTGPSQWLECKKEFYWEDSVMKSRRTYRGYSEEFPLPPNCDGEDQKSLDELLAVVHSRQ